MHAGVGMAVEELEEILTLDEIQLRRLDGLGRHFIGLAENRGTGTENFTRLRDLDDQRLSFRRRGGELRPAAAENEYTARVLSLDEEQRSLRIDAGELHRVHRRDRVVRHVAEEALLPDRAIRAGVLDVEVIG